MPVSILGVSISKIESLICLRRPVCFIYMNRLDESAYHLSWPALMGGQQMSGHFYALLIVMLLCLLRRDLSRPTLRSDLLPGCCTRHLQHHVQRLLLFSHRSFGTPVSSARRSIRLSLLPSSLRSQAGFRLAVSFGLRSLAA